MFVYSHVPTRLCSRVVVDAVVGSATDVALSNNEKTGKNIFFGFLQISLPGSTKEAEKTLIVGIVQA